MGASNHDRHSFWRAWLLVALSGQAVMGLVIAFGYAVVPGLGWHRRGVAESLWGGEVFAPQAEVFRDFIMAVLGATMASWAIALLFVVAVPFARRERWSWWCLAVSVAVWFPVDTGMSLAHGVVVNAVFNLSALTMLAIPLAATWPSVGRA